MLKLPPFATHWALPLTAALIWTGTSTAQSTGPALAAAAAAVVGAPAFSMANPNAGARQMAFDLVALRALPQHSFVTRTPWDTQPIQFSGPLLRDVLKTTGVEGRLIQATALNDYTTTIPVADAHQFDVLLAIHMNGKPIPVRSKGPFFIIYPFDSDPHLQSTTYYERSIWQLKTLNIQ